MDSRKLALLALFASSIIWGAAPPIFKLSLQNIPPFSLAYLRFFIAVFLLLPFCYKRLAFDKKDTISLLIFSLSGITINISFFFWGLKFSDSINAAVLAASAPLFIIIGSVVFLHEKAKVHIILGALLSSIGAITIIIEPLLLKGTQSSIIGNLLFVGATIGAVIHTLSGKSVIRKYGATAATFWSFLIGTMTFVPLAIIETISTPEWVFALDQRGYLGIIFGALFSSFAAYLLWDYGLGKIPAAETSVFYNLNPIVSVLIAVPFLGEKITLPFVFGSLLIFSGITLAEKRIHFHPIRTFKHT